MEQVPLSVFNLMDYLIPKYSG